MDCFPEAAMRHFKDAKILKDKQRYDNAMCHYAFSAECALKAILSASNRSKRGHNLINLNANLLQVISTSAGSLAFLNTKFSAAVQKNSVPPKLAQDHPERRYFASQSYTKTEIEEAEQYAEFLTDQIVQMVADGVL
ncbi:HEPN domain-containing protein [Stomatobaculum longum]|uniref:HEPN domain-containing protein n=1 Tax=Stomatobaculum longum TaxID=796942 RepID=UPI0028801A69|nr:HEPN domain-containing protein [Stomatobaculum longum]